MENLTYATPTQASLFPEDSDINQVRDVTFLHSVKKTSIPKTITKFLTEIEVTNLDSEEREAIYQLARNLALDDIANLGPSLDRPKSVESYLRSILMGLEREAFAVVFLNNQNKVIKYEELFYGTVDSASVFPRIILQRALKINACSILISHNHPSGNLEPSKADLAITHRIQQALAIVDIPLLDHIIVSKAGAMSFARKGLL